MRPYKFVCFEGCLSFKLLLSKQALVVCPQVHQPSESTTHWLVMLLDASAELNQCSISLVSSLFFLIAIRHRDPAKGKKRFWESPLFSTSVWRLMRRWFAHFFPFKKGPLLSSKEGSLIWHHFSNSHFKKNQEIWRIWSDCKDFQHWELQVVNLQKINENLPILTLKSFIPFLCFLIEKWGFHVKLIILRPILVPKASTPFFSLQDLRHHQTPFVQQQQFD